MPTGLSKIKQINQEAAARKAAYDQGGPGVRFLRLEDGQTARVRFLEQGEEVHFVYTHRLPRQPGQGFPQATPCLDQEDSGQPCPACERGEKRGYQLLLNLIWFNAPKFQRDGEGKTVKDGNKKPLFVIDPATQKAVEEPTIAVWETGPTNGDRITHLDEIHNGLTNGIYTITRKGSTKDDTTYFIDLEQTVEPTAHERELASGKADLKTVKKTMSYADMNRAYSGGGSSVEGQPSGGNGQPPVTQPDPGPGNAFQNAASGGAIKRGAFS